MAEFAGCCRESWPLWRGTGKLRLQQDRSTVLFVFQNWAQQWCSGNKFEKKVIIILALDQFDWNLPKLLSVIVVITYRAKLLNGDWFRQRAFFLNFPSMEGKITWSWLGERQNLLAPDWLSAPFLHLVGFLKSFVQNNFLTQRSLQILTFKPTYSVEMHGNQPRPQAYTRYASEPSYQPEAWNRAR